MEEIKDKQWEEEWKMKKKVRREENAYKKIGPTRNQKRTIEQGKE